jgi:hypothetical protein
VDLEHQVVASSVPVRELGQLIRHRPRPHVSLELEIPVRVCVVDPPAVLARHATHDGHNTNACACL